MKRASIEFPDEAIAWHVETLLGDSPLPLKDGSRLDLNQPWEVPQQQEK